MYYVEIVDKSTKEVIKRLGGVPSIRMAERLEGGVCINLDHERFRTRIVTGADMPAGEADEAAS